VADVWQDCPNELSIQPHQLTTGLRHKLLQQQHQQHQQQDKLEEVEGFEMIIKLIEVTNE
jgi:hypothetical protein